MSLLPPELGTLALTLAFAVSLIQATIPLIGAQRMDARLMAVSLPAAFLTFALVAVAFAVLTEAFVLSDFSVRTVAANSHTLKPMLYKVSGVWGNHEGSLLLWMLILSVFGAAVALFGKNLTPSFRARVLSVQAMIAIGFLAFMLFTSNPFERLSPAPLEGMGLNPLLQDPGLAFHPPFLYLGYVGFSIAFAFAIAALMEGRIDATFARWVRPWTVAAWSFLTIGIAMGSWWAYYELGWGGFWFWDPVENASFMPWLLGTALIHSLAVTEKREALKSWTVLLAILAFSLSLLGTFLVRSGVLTSVHAFATDPARGVFILAFLIAVVGGALTLFAIRASALTSGGRFDGVSRETTLIINNWLMAVAAGTVLLGTLYPLLLDALTGDKISVGPPFFNATFGPIFGLAVLVMVVGPLTPWKTGDLATTVKRLLPALLAAVAGAAIAYIGQPAGANPLAIIGFALGLWVIGGTLYQYALQAGLGTRGLTFARLKALPARAHGLTLAHFGMGIIVLGVTGNTAWTQEHLGLMRIGDEAQLGGYTFTLKGVSEHQGPNYAALRGHFDVADGKRVFPLAPELRIYQQPPQTTTEAGIRPTLFGDVFAAIGEPKADGRIGVRLYVKPLVSWIWVGALMVAFGGFISLVRRRKS